MNELFQKFSYKNAFHAILDKIHLYKKFDSQYIRIYLKCNKKTTILNTPARFHYNARETKKSIYKTTKILDNILVNLFECERIVH